MSSANEPCFTSFTTHALTRGNVQTIGQIRSDGLHRDSGLAGFGFLGTLTFFFVAETGGEELRPIRDGDGRLLLLAVADKGEFGFRAGLATGDIRYELVAGLDSLPSTEVIVSPILSPAVSAGLPATTLDTVTPAP